MSSKLSVLLTEPNQKNSLGIARSLGSKNINIFFISKNKYDQSNFSKYCKGVLNIKKKEYDKNLIRDFIVKNKIDLVIPVGTESTIFFSKNITFFENYTNFFVPNPHQLEKTLSKISTLKISEKLGIPFPKTIFPKTVHEAIEEAKKMDFPCVIKWAHEIGETRVEYPKDIEDFEIKYKKMVSYLDNSKDYDLPLIQEKVEGQGVGNFAFFVEGKKIAFYQHIRIREAPPTGGVSVCAESIYMKELEELSDKILNHLKWNGVAMVEFKKRIDGSLVLMEVNPKFWGSLDLGLTLGINFPFKMLKTLNENLYIEDFAKKNYSIGLRYHWPLEGDIKYMFSDIKRLKNVIYDLLNPNVKSNLHLFSDPMPTLITILLNLRLVFLKSMGIKK